MRTALVLGLLLQLGALDTAGPAAAPDHLRWQRAISLQPGAGGQACAVLDANVFAHAAGRSANDLRLFANGSEVPFVLSESEPAAADVVAATVQNLGMQNGDIVFDLAMPARAYTTVDLKIAAKDFIATAKVSGSDSHGGAPIALGTFALFDLSRQRLSHSTALALQESTFPKLHIVLHVNSIDGGAFTGLTPSIVEGAQVPPSREAQTLYTPVAVTTTISQKGPRTVATLQIPAQVPVERVSFVVAPTFARDFLRGVTVTAHAAAQADGDERGDERIDGEIWRVSRPAIANGPAISGSELYVDAEVGSNLRQPATISVAVNNGNDAPLPLVAVQLEMRQRTLCFDAVAAQTYVLRYGDDALHAPIYDYARLFQGQQHPLVATLGPEQVNPGFEHRADTRPYTERHPEVLWVALLLMVAVLGGTALHSIKKQTHRSPDNGPPPAA